MLCSRKFWALHVVETSRGGGDTASKVIHCPKHNLNLLIKTMPVTVREDVNVYEYAWFNGFFRYVLQKPGILHMYI